MIKKADLVGIGDVTEVRREVEILQRLSKEGHQNLLAVEGVYEDAECVYIVMELCRGGELYDVILKGFLDERDAAGIFRQITEATAFCHRRGILHRDLKPENVLLASEQPAQRSAGGPPPLVKLVDFGLAVYLEEGEQTEGCAGSRFYEAPEVICGKKYGWKADSWSLGVILYAMLSGRLPFLGSDRRALISAVRKGRVNFEDDPWPSVSEGAKKLVKRLLTVDPQKRMCAEEVLSDPWLLEFGSQSPKKGPAARCSSSLSGSSSSDSPWPSLLSWVTSAPTHQDETGATVPYSAELPPADLPLSGTCSNMSMLSATTGTTTAANSVASTPAMSRVASLELPEKEQTAATPPHTPPQQISVYSKLHWPGQHPVVTIPEPEDGREGEDEVLAGVGVPAQRAQRVHPGISLCWWCTRPRVDDSPREAAPAIIQENVWFNPEVGTLCDEPGVKASSRVGLGQTGSCWLGSSRGPRPGKVVPVGVA